jgi:hypothetical protein
VTDADVWLTVGKIALLGFLVLGPATVVITYIRRSRSGVTGWRPPNGSRYPDALGDGATRIYLYGPDCHAVWSAIDAVARALPQPPTSAVLRPGGPGAESHGDSVIR